MIPSMDPGAGPVVERIDKPTIKSHNFNQPNDVLMNPSLKNHKATENTNPRKICNTGPNVTQEDSTGFMKYDSGGFSKEVL